MIVMSRYIYELANWPHFTWNAETVLPLLARVEAARGFLLGKMQLLGLLSQNEIGLSVLTEDIAKSAKIEGENLDVRAIRSSVARRLGVELSDSIISKQNVEGMVEVTLNAIYDYSSPLTYERLCSWQAALFPTGYSGMRPLAVGRYRDDAGGPMQVISGAFGHETVHYQAPRAAILEREMGLFLDWFNREDNLNYTLKALVRICGLSHCTRSKTATAGWHGSLAIFCLLKRTKCPSVFILYLFISKKTKNSIIRFSKKLKKKV
jgi:Fic family protein